MFLGERPFACDLCDKAFSSDGDMKRHRKRHFKPLNKVTGNNVKRTNIIGEFIECGSSANGGGEINGNKKSKKRVQTPKQIQLGKDLGIIIWVKNSYKNIPTE